MSERTQNGSRLNQLLGWVGGASDVVDGRRYLQSRVTLFSGLTCLVILPFALVFGGSALLEQRPQSEAGLLAMLALSFIAWQFCRRGERSTATLHAIEGFGSIGLCVLDAVVSDRVEMEASPDLIGLLGVFAIVTLRAALVPSSALRTGLVGILGSAPHVWLAWERLPLIPADSLVGVDVYQVRVVLWSVAAVTISTITSHVIYGLQAKVREVTQLGQYALERKIGEGGMGRVYRGRHVLLRRPTAIKLLPPERSSEQAIARFEREVVQTSRLCHPNTVAIYDYGRTPEGLFYYAMEYLDGFSLAQLITHDGPQPAERVAHVLRQVAASLAEAHDNGLIHRDIKPANIMITRRGGIDDFVKVLDFGLVKDLTGGEDVRFTREDVVTGTPLYLPPEAVTAPDAVDERGDLYSLGVVAFELLTGHPLFSGATAAEVIGKHVHEQPTPVSAFVEVPAALEAVVLRCLAKAPEDRFRSAGDLRKALTDCTPGGWSNEEAKRWWTDRAPKVAGSLSEEVPEEPASGGEQNFGLTVNVGTGR